MLMFLLLILLIINSMICITPLRSCCYHGTKLFTKILHCSSSSSSTTTSTSTSTSPLNTQRDKLKLKVRQHVNPLALKYQIPIKLDDNWLKEAYDDPNRPFVIDIGCAKGTWALNYAKRHSDVNVLGLEIRRPVVEFALKRKVRWGLRNVHFLSCNANVDLDRILSTITGIDPQKKNNNPSIELLEKNRNKNKVFNKESEIDDEENDFDNDDNVENDYEETMKAYNDFLVSNLQQPIDFQSATCGSSSLFKINYNNNSNDRSYIKLVTLQFPDPHFKTKHKKRRVMNDELVQTITKHIQPMTPIFVQSDILEVLEDIVETLSSSVHITPSSEYNIKHLNENKNMVGIPTEREIATLAKNLPVYRMLFYKK